MCQLYSPLRLSSVSLKTLSNLLQRRRAQMKFGMLRQIEAVAEAHRAGRGLQVRAHDAIPVLAPADLPANYRVELLEYGGLHVRPGGPHDRVKGHAIHLQPG